jgi:GntR family transcriptional regulator/MocR family aminotransferase
VSGRPRLPYDFRYGAPSMHDFPVQIWQRCLGRRARRASAAYYDYGHPQGSPALRAALAGYLLRGRGVRCEPEQLQIVSGSQQGLDLAARLLLSPRDTAVVEEPGYEGARRSWRRRAAGTHAHRRRRPRRRRARARGRRARLAHVTPSRSTLGGVMPYPRRVALLAWAARTGTARGHSTAIPRRPSPRRAERSTTAARRLPRHALEVMFGLRIGYLVLRRLWSPFARAKLLADGGSAFLNGRPSPISSRAAPSSVTSGARAAGTASAALLLRALDERACASSA